jgi:predicted dehydrogenase
LENGKGVLCEKPFAINRQEAELMVRTAQENDTFLMEGMWTRFLPAVVRLRQLLSEGVIGEVRMLTADFGFRAGLTPEGRLFNLELGGGALLDVGVYTVSLASMLFGKPEKISSLAHIGKTGVDEQAGIVLLHSKGELAVLSTAVRTTTPQEAVLMGTEGSIKICSPWWVPSQLELKGKTIDLPFNGNGFNYEAVEAMNCIQSGRTESKIIPHQETLSIMDTLDQIRHQWGLIYPTEKKSER